MLEYWPQITWIALAAMGTIAMAARHGERIEVNFGHRLIGLPITVFLLYMGGFFS